MKTADEWAREINPAHVRRIQQELVPGGAAIRGVFEAYYAQGHAHTQPDAKIKWSPVLYPLHLFPEESAVLLDMPPEALIAVAKMGNPLACALVPIKIASLKKRKQRDALRHLLPIIVP